MAHPLYLLANEKRAFTALPEALQRATVVEDESLTFSDTKERRAIRMRNLKLSHSALKKIQRQSKQNKLTQKDMTTIVDTTDLSGLSEKDIIELAFVWGPDFFSVMIVAALANAKTAEDIENAAGLSDMRHGLLMAFNR